MILSLFLSLFHVLRAAAALCIMIVLVSLHASLHFSRSLRDVLACQVQQYNSISELHVLLKFPRELG
jgi:hypothetical protein